MLQGPQPEEVVRGLLDAGRIPDGVPWSVRVDHQPTKPTRTWLSANLTKAKRVQGTFDDGSMLSFDRDGLVAFQRVGIDLDDPATLLELARLPFELASAGPI